MTQTFAVSITKAMVPVFKALLAISSSYLVLKRSSRRPLALQLVKCETPVADYLVRTSRRIGFGDGLLLCPHNSEGLLHRGIERIRRR